MPQPSIVPELVAEEQRLSLKLQKVRELLALYAPTDSVGARSEPTGQGQARQPRAQGRGDDQILDAADDLIVGRTRPTPTIEILAHLEAIGVHVGGKIPRNNLSSKLSHSDRFIAHGRSGWTSARNDSGGKSREAPDDTPDPASSSEASSEAGVGRSGGPNGVHAPVN